MSKDKAKFGWDVHYYEKTTKVKDKIRVYAETIEAALLKAQKEVGPKFHVTHARTPIL